MNETRLVLRVDQIFTDLPVGPCFQDEQRLFATWYKQQEPPALIQGAVYFADNMRPRDQRVCPDSEHITNIVLDGHRPVFSSLGPSSEDSVSVERALVQLYYWADQLVDEEAALKLEAAGFPPKTVTKFKEAVKNVRN